MSWLKVEKRPEEGNEGLYEHARQMTENATSCATISCKKKEAEGGGYGQFPVFVQGSKTPTTTRESNKKKGQCAP